MYKTLYMLLALGFLSWGTPAQAQVTCPPKDWKCWKDAYHSLQGKMVKLKNSLASSRDALSQCIGAKKQCEKLHRQALKACTNPRPSVKFLESQRQKRAKPPARPKATVPPSTKEMPAPSPESEVPSPEPKDDHSWPLRHQRLALLFLATDNCPAFHSIRKRTNPGNFYVERGRRYVFATRNKPNATFYQIIIGGGRGMRRWVSVHCGNLISPRQSASPKQRRSQPRRDFSRKRKTSRYSPSSKKDYLLAISWQPAFCQTHQDRRECRSQTTARYDATNLSLHGLWPQPRYNLYCGVSSHLKRLDKRRRWRSLPPLGLSQSFLTKLTKFMPGAMSYLHRHEWYKHGTCYNDDPKAYYAHSMSLLQQINTSKVKELFARNIGSVITSRQIRKAFDAAFGQGAGSKVYVVCKRGMIVELRVNLTGKIDTNTSIKKLLQAAPTASRGCSSGLVDPVGF